MAEAFNRPSKYIGQQDTYSDTEVGLTNPTTPAFMKLLDNGDIEIIAQDGVGIILSAESQTITFIGHAIQFLTTDMNGLVWNRTAFNSQATTYSEAALIQLADNDLSKMFNGVENYLPSGDV